jgi:16S rRNA (uracil1498-N3)-methyltransferase
VTAPHFFVWGETLQPGLSIPLAEEDTHHASRVLRLQEGEEITIADDRGAVADAHVIGFPGQRVLALVDAVRRVTRAQPSVHVVLAPPKGDRLAWAVQKATEVGADAISLMACERGVRDWPTPDRSERTHLRLSRVARESSMQARRPFLTQVGWFEDLREVLSAFDRFTGDRIVMLHEAASARLSQVSWDVLPRTVVLLIGPEGGFSPSELDLAGSIGVSIASLGPPILRTETAAVVGATLALARYGRLG